ncbi:MAG: hypothetical protein ABI970_15435 [Chloroflexota bacterium]
MSLRRRYMIVLLFALTLFSLSATIQATNNAIQLVSVSSTGMHGNKDSFSPSMSADGRFVAFRSSATNLIPFDTNNADDIFVHDGETGQTQIVSVSGNGVQGNSDSFYPSISGDGRFVAFGSYATNLVANDTNGHSDIFVHDRQTGQTEIVSVSSDGVQANATSLDSVISQDGWFVAFVSGASNLVANYTGGVFVRDRQTGQTEIVSVSSDGVQGGGINPSISGDGRFVTFETLSSSLVANDTNGHSDIFVRDRQTHQTEIVSVASDGTQGNSTSADSAISADGRFVAFDSYATNLVSDDTHTHSDIFVHDRQTGQTEIVSVSSKGLPGDGNSVNPSMSADGRFVAFTSEANNLASNPANFDYDTFVHDRLTGQTEVISVSSNYTQRNVNRVSEQPSINADGRFIAFSSLDNTLVANDNNVYKDVFEAYNVLIPLAPVRNYFTVLPITLTWNRISWAVGYEVEIAKNNNFAQASMVIHTTTAANQLYINISTIDDGTYYWRVHAQIDDTHWGGWSASDSFVVAVS